MNDSTYHPSSDGLDVKLPTITKQQDEDFNSHVFNYEHNISMKQTEDNGHSKVIYSSTTNTHSNRISTSLYNHYGNGEY